MAFAPRNEDIQFIGTFTEKAVGNYFDYSMNAEYIEHIHPRNGKPTEYPHKVWVTTPRRGIDQGYREALVLKTVAYIVVDEDENGPVIEKWDIKDNYVSHFAPEHTPGEQLLKRLAA